MTVDWKALAADVISYRDAKGFAVTTWDDLPTRLCCLHSECRELEDALATSFSTAARAVRHECADIAMYALTILHDLGAPSWDLRQSYHQGASRFGSPAEFVAPLRKHVDDAFRAWRRGDQKDALICIELVLVALVDLKGRVLGHESSVAFDVRAKIAVSKDRPRTHGKDPRS